MSSRKRRRGRRASGDDAPPAAERAPAVYLGGTARELAAGVVARVLDAGAWTQPALASALSSTKSLDARDKAFCTELVYGTLRWATPLEISLLRGADKPQRGLDERIRPHLLVAAYQLQFLSDRIPPHAAVNDAVNAVRRVRPGLEGFANALLRKLGSPLIDALPPSASLDELATALGVPPLLAQAITRGLPAEQHRAALRALNDRPSTYAYSLSRSAPSAQAHPFVPRAFVLDGGAVDALPGFADGDFIVMDPGSALAALLVCPAEGARVIDLCAAPGGKTALLASLGANVIAVEKSAIRARKITETVRRVKLEARVKLVVADALDVELPKQMGMSGTTRADAVLLDAPCTGFGTTRRKPEIKWRRTEKDVDADALLQQQLLARAADLVNPGGTLVYSVCSPLEAEGPAQITRLLAARDDFVIAPLPPALSWIPESAIDERGCIRLLPHRHDADAFFCARLTRKVR